MDKKDTYYTIDTASAEVIFKERGSAFYGYAFPVSSLADIKSSLEILKKKHHTAKHFCYAWQLGSPAMAPLTFYLNPWTSYQN